MWSANSCFGSIAVYLSQDSEVFSVKMVGDNRYHLINALFFPPLEYSIPSFNMTALSALLGLLSAKQVHPHTLPFIHCGKVTH